MSGSAEWLLKGFFRGVFRRFKRYGYAIVTFGAPVIVDDFIAQHPDVLAMEFDDRKEALRLLAENVMKEISDALPITPVTLVAHILRENEPLTEQEIAERIDAVRVVWHDRLRILREKNGAEIWRAARNVLELRRLVEPAPKWRSDLFDGSGVPVIEDAWQWNPHQRLLRDYYANALMPFDDVKARGWPDERQPRGGTAVQ